MHSGLIVSAHAHRASSPGEVETLLVAEHCTGDNHQTDGPYADFIYLYLLYIGTLYIKISLKNCYFPKVT